MLVAHTAGTNAWACMSPSAQKSHTLLSGGMPLMAPGGVAKYYTIEQGSAFFNLRRGGVILSQGRMDGRWVTPQDLASNEDLRGTVIWVGSRRSLQSTKILGIPADGWCSVAAATIAARPTGRLGRWARLPGINDLTQAQQQGERNLGSLREWANGKGIHVAGLVSTGEGFLKGWKIGLRNTDRYREEKGSMLVITCDGHCWLRRKRGHFTLPAHMCADESTYLGGGGSTGDRGSMEVDGDANSAQEGALGKCRKGVQAPMGRTILPESKIMRNPIHAIAKALPGRWEQQDVQRMMSGTEGKEVDTLVREAADILGLSVSMW